MRKKRKLGRPCLCGSLFVIHCLHLVSSPILPLLPLCRTPERKQAADPSGVFQKKYTNQQQLKATRLIFNQQQSQIPQAATIVSRSAREAGDNRCARLADTSALDGRKATTHTHTHFTAQSDLRPLWAQQVRLHLLFRLLPLFSQPYRVSIVNDAHREVAHRHTRTPLCVFKETFSVLTQKPRHRLSTHKNGL